MQAPKVISITTGIFLLAAFLLYGGGQSMISGLINQSLTPDSLWDHRTTFAIGALFMLMNSFIVVGIGILLFPVLEHYCKRTALLYLSTRMVEAVFLAISTLCLLLIVFAGKTARENPEAASIFQTLADYSLNGNFISYQIGMLTLGIGSLFFCYALFKFRLVPRWLSIWGIAGYAVLAFGCAAELFGLEIGVLLSAPGGLFEVIFAIWLIVKGFRLPSPLSKG